MYSLLHSFSSALGCEKMNNTEYICIAKGGGGGKTRKTKTLNAQQGLINVLLIHSCAYSKKAKKNPERDLKINLLKHSSTW